MTSTPPTPALCLAWEYLDALAALRSLAEQQAAAAEGNGDGWDALGAERVVLTRRLRGLGARLAALSKDDRTEEWRRAQAEIQREMDAVIGLDMRIEAAFSTRCAELETALALARSRRQRHKGIVEP